MKRKSTRSIKQETGESTTEQVARFKALARNMGVNEDEAAFDKALAGAAARKPPSIAKRRGTH